MMYQLAKHKFLEDVTYWNRDGKKVSAIREGDIIECFGEFDENSKIPFYVYLYAPSPYFNNTILELHEKKTEVIEIVKDIPIAEYFEDLNVYSNFKPNHNNREVRNVRVRIDREVYWDNWGRFVKVFNVGDEVWGRGYFCKEGLLQDISLESTIYEGTSDGVPLEDITLLDVGEALKKPYPSISSDINAED